MSTSLGVQGTAKIMRRLVAVAATGLATWGLISCTRPQNGLPEEPTVAGAQAEPRAQAALIHNYVFEEDGLFGYGPSLSPEDRAAGRTTSALLMMRYGGHRDGVYEFYKPDAPQGIPTMTCSDPCSVMKVLVFSGGTLNVQYIPVTSDSILGALVEDAKNGFLDHALPAVAAQSQAEPITAAGLLAPTITKTEAPLVETSSSAAQVLPAETRSIERPAPTQPSASYSEAEIFHPTTSLDCGSANTDAQRLICSDLELGEQQVTLNRRFDADRLRLQAKLTSDAYTAFLGESSTALQHRDDDCHDKACISAWYETRAAQLGSWEAKAP
jgi:hypothetical protein